VETIIFTYIKLAHKHYSEQTLDIVFLWT